MKVNVKQHIVETASQLFYENGYNLTGINEIIGKAKIAKATLYHHFRSKEELCVAYLEYRHTVFMSDIDAFVQRQKGSNSGIVAIFGFLKSFFKQKEFNGCWCLNTFSELPKDQMKVKKVIQDKKSDFLKYLQGLVQASLPNLSVEQRKALGRKIYLLYESAISESQLHQNIWPINEAEKMAKNLIQ